MKKLNLILLTLLVIPFYSLSIEAPKMNQPIIVNGLADEKDWQKATWHPLNHNIIGEITDENDFNGRFKVMWNNDKLLILAEITDDKLIDQHADPLYLYWDDDCIEIFIDEDFSGGDHRTNFNAFAYHVALDNQAVDIGPEIEKGKTNFILLNDHVNSRWRRSAAQPNKIVWELAISIYDDTFSLDKNKKHRPLTLFKDKVLGFMLAYCDNDNSKIRENFIGSHAIEPVNGDKNRGFFDANVFGKLTLVE